MTWLLVGLGFLLYIGLSIVISLLIGQTIRAGKGPDQ